MQPRTVSPLGSWTGLSYPENPEKKRKRQLIKNQRNPERRREQWRLAQQNLRARQKGLRNS